MENVIPFRRDTAPDDEVAHFRSLTTKEGVHLMVESMQGTGVTWKEVAGRLGIHHGAASGALSRLHANGRIARLAEHRDGCAVYVSPAWVEDRKVEAARLPRQNLLGDMAQMLRRVHKGCDHDLDLPHPTCKQCDIGLLLRRYDRGLR